MRITQVSRRLSSGRAGAGAILAACLLGALGWPAGAGAPIGWEALSRLDQLPAYKSSIKVGAVSSYDRTGGNDDGFSGKYSFIRKEAGGLVLADLKGPGVITRLWTPTPTDDPIEFLLDGEAEPRVSVGFRDLFLGKDPAFPRPLVGFGAGGYYSYVPVPFAKSCVVRIRGPKVQFYQINYALYGPETTVASFTRELSPADQRHREQAIELFRSPGADGSQWAAPPGARIELSTAEGLVAPGSTWTVFRAGTGGRIVGLRFTPAEAMAGKARDLLLRIAFDGEAPAVVCPLGDFFGYAWGQPAMRSVVAGTVGGTNYCYLPMPFDRSAVVEVASEAPGPVVLRAEVLHAAVPRRAEEGKLYAVWRRENPTRLGEPYTFLDAVGRGHLVGVILQAQGFESGKTLFFEGDDQTTIDGELAIHGTGSEDFFNGGWYDVPDRWEKRISFPLSGCLGYAKHLGRTGAYRWFLGDAYAYRQSLRQTIEHAGEKNSIPTDYCSVTYLYSERPPVADPGVPPGVERAVQDLAEVVFPVWWQMPIHAWSFENATLARRKEKIGNEEIRFLSLTTQGSDWFGPHFLSLTCDVPVAGSYRILIEALKGPAQGRVQLFRDENPVGDAVDLYAVAREASGRVLLGRLDLAEGANNLMIKLVGKHKQASGLGLDLISVVCSREP
ncbi:MAG TPA: DUF2961 domain-containing protein [Verrucomicrobiota bacterium]|nr:DUF2961 domain-containing protein [Verrucomicrobiota bacterium]HNU53057.1 DUF2961 domain-containing protein [Verrucomicrobiota bacterium]